MTIQKYAPICLFVYNRFDYTKRTVEALKNNILAKKSDLIIISDAAKTAENAGIVREIRNYIRQIKGFKSVSIVEREINFGLAKSILDGVTTVVEKHGRIIVLEDDIVTSPYFLNFMNDGLEFYKNSENVMHISGYVYPIDSVGLMNTFFLRPTTCWGWATWDRAWKFYNKDADYYLRIFSKDMIRDFNLSHAYKYFDQIKLNKIGKLNTWAIFWYASVYLNNGLSLHPKKSYTKNIGFEGSGTNCEITNVYDVELVNEYQPIFIQSFKEDIFARAAFENYFNGIKVSFCNRLVKKIWNLY
jgi:hypothetical protein